MCRYGEGWDFGEVAKNGRGINASQFNLSGTGIGRYYIIPHYWQATLCPSTIATKS